jgi:hypothetical protein
VSSMTTVTSTFGTPSTLSSNPFWEILPFAWLESTGAVILAVVVLLVLVSVFVLKRRRS